MVGLLSLDRGRYLAFLHLLLRMGAPQRGALCIGVTSLTHVKEVTKKTCQDVPSWISLSLPLCKADRGEKHICFLYISRHKSTRAAGEGSHRVSNIVERMGEGERSQFAKQIDAERQRGEPRLSR